MLAVQLILRKVETSVAALQQFVDVDLVDVFRIVIRHEVGDHQVILHQIVDRRAAKLNDAACKYSLVHLTLDIVSKFQFKTSEN